MNHNITAAKFGVTIRPVSMEDAEFIHKLRRDPVLSEHIGEVDERLSVHASWMERYFERDGDYYFCIALDGDGETPVGTIALYDVADGSAEWGRWIMKPSVPAAAASAWLVYHVAFDVLGLHSVYCRSVSDNKHVLSFHDRSGLRRTGIERNGLCIRGAWKDMVVHTALRSDWSAIQKNLEPAAQLAMRFLQR
ncbi:GNAT family N-acetyltransferase [Paenibacillus gansuensis]|uniref:GNAT family N-acetyltransferase n=1 Tax=Paenibacillus gansuensis TaxID=306542 RepID=A0ABW5PD23_9BACL